MGDITNFDWEDLLFAIRESSVIPVVGAEMRLLEQDGKPCTVEYWSLQQLPEKLDLEIDPSTATLNQLALKVLDDVPLPKKERRKRMIASTVVEVFTENPPPIPESLLKLAEITDFNLFITTAVDTLLEQAIEQVRGVPCLTMANSLTAGIDDFVDMEPPNQPCVYHLFGAMPRGEEYAGTDIAITEEDKLEYLQELGDNANKPRNLLDFLNDEDNNRELMFLGCSLTDGVARLMLRTLADCRLFPEKSFKFVCSQDKIDDAFRFFLEGLNTELLLTANPGEFTDEMHKRWKEASPEPGSADDSSIQPMPNVSKQPKRAKGSDDTAEGFVVVS
jgi:hypothetical protein